MPNEKFDLTRANENISALCDYIEQVNKPNPLNPVGLSDMAYHNIMTGLHENTWIESFVPEMITNA